MSQHTALVGKRLTMQVSMDVEIKGLSDYLPISGEKVRLAVEEFPKLFQQFLESKLRGGYHSEMGDPSPVDFYNFHIHDISC